MPILLCAITSCGTQGETGPKGETGAQGPKGETGEKGEKGDTYYPVVILGADGGSISTDVISGKSGDKYTLTFTPSKSGNIVHYLEINYEEVELTDEILNGSYTGTFSDDAKNGAVVVYAEFGTVLDYAQGLVVDFYNSLADVDYQLAYLYDTDSGYVVGDRYALYSATDAYKAYAPYFVHGDYYDNSVATLALSYVNKVETELSKDANKNKTAKEKIELAKTILSEAETKVNEKYAEVLKSAKAKAKVTAKNLYNNGDKVTYSNGTLAKEDSTKLFEAAKTAIDGATTLSGVTAAVDTKVDANGAKLGAYNELERMRKKAFDELAESKNDVETALKPGSSEDEQEAYTELKEDLAAYGIDELPMDVYEKYEKEIAAATSIDYGVNSTTGKTDYSSTALGTAGAKAVKESYKAIISTLRAAILKSYDEEIYASKVITEEKSRDNAHTQVENIIAAWFSTYMPANGRTIANMVSFNDAAYTATATGTGYTTGDKMSLLSYIEDQFKDWNPEFTVERIANKKAAVVKNIVAAYNKILDGDSVYKAIINVKGTGTSGAVEDSDLTAVDEAYDLADDTAKTIYNSSVANIKKVLVGFVGSKLDGSAGTITSKTTVAELGAYEDESIATLEKDYGKVTDNYEEGSESALQLFKDKNDVDFTEYKPNGSSDGYVIKKATLEAAYGKLFVTEDEDGEEVILTKTCDQILAVVKDSSSWIDDVTYLDKQYNAWLEETDDDDANLPIHQTEDGTKVWGAVEDQLKAILTGSSTGNVATDGVIGSLSSLYTEDVATYLEDTLETLEVVYNTQLSVLASGANAAKLIPVLKQVYSAALALKGEKSFKYTITGTSLEGGVTSGTEVEVENAKCETYAGVDAFNEAVIKLIKNVKAGTTTIKIGDKTISISA